MSEISDILLLHDRALQSQAICAFATVISTDGPSYRSAGARSLIIEDGTFRGGLSAGCLESDIACRLDAGTESFVVEYDLSTEDDIRGFPFGCGGTVQIFVEPLPNSGALHAVQWISNLNEPAVLLTVIKVESKIQKKAKEVEADAELGTIGEESIKLKRKLGTIEEKPTDLDSETIKVGSRFGRSQSGADKFEDGFFEFENLCSKYFELRRSCLQIVETPELILTVFAEYLEPAVNICIFGDGEDARTLASLSEAIGMNVQRIPRNQIRNCTSLFEEFPALQHSHAVVMTHDLNLDTLVLKQLIQSMPPYVGVMGPRIRTEKILNNIGANASHVLSLNDFYAPVGLNLAAETPQEIALSILSEIQAVANGTTPAHLRNSSGAIHDRAVPSNRERTETVGHV